MINTKIYPEDVMGGALEPPSRTPLQNPQYRTPGPEPQSRTPLPILFIYMLVAAVILTCQLELLQVPR